MKKRTNTITKICLLFILFLLITVCHIPEEGRGHLQLTMRTHCSKVEGIIFLFTLHGPESEPRSEETAETEILFEEIPAGFWQITIIAKDIGGAIITEKNIEAIITNNQILEKEVYLDIDDFCSQYYELTILTDGNGTTNPAGLYLVNIKNPTLIIKAESHMCTLFKEWTVESGDPLIHDPKAELTTLTLRGDAAIKAHFEPITYSLIMSCGPGGSIVEPVESLVNVECGSEIIVAALPDNGYYFVNWTAIPDTTYIDFPDLAFTTVVLNDGNAVIQANFSETPVPTAAPTAPPEPGEICLDPLTISVPFAQNGSGDFCWQTTTLGNYINSWNLALLEINGVNFTNRYAAASGLPAKIDEYYYIHYVGNYSWSHFEAN